MADSEADRDVWVEGLQHLVAMASVAGLAVRGDELEPPSMSMSTETTSDVQVWLRQHGLDSVGNLLFDMFGEHVELQVRNKNNSPYFRSDSWMPIAERLLCVLPANSEHGPEGD